MFTYGSSFLFKATYNNISSTTYFRAKCAFSRGYAKTLSRDEFDSVMNLIGSFKAL